MYVYIEVQTLLINGRTALFLITPPQDLQHWNNAAGGAEDKLCLKAYSEMPPAQSPPAVGLTSALRGKGEQEVSVHSTQLPGMRRSCRSRYTDSS